jgi:hypothetical protein
MFTSSTEIQPFVHGPFPVEAATGATSMNEEEDDIFTYFSDFHTRLRMEIPVCISVGIVDDDGQIYYKLETLSRSLDLYAHIPPIYLVANRSKYDRGGCFMASFGAHSSILAKPRLVAVESKWPETLKQQNLGYSKQCFSLGYIHDLKPWRQYFRTAPPAANTRDDYGSIIAWIHFHMSASTGSQVIFYHGTIFIQHPSSHCTILCLHGQTYVCE